MPNSPTASNPFGAHGILTQQMIDNASLGVQAVQALQGPAPALPQPAPAPALDADGNPIRRGQRKAYSKDSDEEIRAIFRVPEAYLVSQEKVDLFLTHHEWLATATHKMAGPKTLVGIEVEVENLLRIDPNVQLLFWNMKTDNSLRNNGVEFTTKGVVSAGNVEAALKQLFDGMNPDVDFSPRTSIHVHLDVRQLSLNQVLGLLLIYTAVENVLFKYAGLTRRSNIFCVPITETGLFANLGGNPTQFIWSIDSHWSKYTALNLLPIISQGSVEFRHMPGTRNVQQLLVWIDLITRLKLYTYRHSLESIVSQISTLNGSSRYKHFVEDVFGDASVYLDTTDLLRDMEKPVYIVKNSVISNKFNEKVIANPQAESQLGRLINGWASTLSKEQYSALIELCRIWKNTNHEQIFRDIVSRPKLYLTSHPQYAALINTLLKATPQEKKPKNFPGYDEFMNIGIQNEGNF